MNLNNLLQNTNYWYKNAFEIEGGRKPVFLEVLSSFNNKPINILEIGTTGGDITDPNGIHGAGRSTFYFAEYIRQNGGQLIAVDNNPIIIENAKEMLQDFIKTNTNIQFICDEGLNHILNKNIDLIYLDGSDLEAFTFEAFRLINRCKTKVLCDDANGWDRGLGKCVRLRKHYQDYKLYKIGPIHEMIFYDIIKENNEKFKIGELYCDKVLEGGKSAPKDSNKLYVCGITQNKLNKIKDIINLCSPYVDGFVWTDHHSNDGTYELLESNKKDGKIYQINYSKDHDVSANIYLRGGHIKQGDWVFVLDSSDLPNEVFLKRLKEDIGYWDKNNVGLVYGDRPWLFKYYETVYFYGTPHWGTAGHIGKTVNLSTINGWRKENYIFNRRDTLESGFLHPIRYYWEFGRSNHLQLLYLQFSNEIFQFHENMRIRFKLSCEQELGLNSSVDSLKDYMINNVGNYPQWFEEVLEMEVNLKDAFRLFVLGQDWKSLANRFDWSYQIWKTQGIIDQPGGGEYVGLFNQYRQAQGKTRE